MLQSSAPSSVSAAKVAANRLNARKSTGPRTPRGKAVAARNALKHGLFARSLLLPGEDAAELTTLKTAFVRRLNPRDPMELALVERVVSAAWKLQRLEAFEASLYQRECDSWDENPLNSREKHGLGRRECVPATVAYASAAVTFHAQLDRLATQQRHLEGGMRRSLRELSLLQKQDIYEPVTEYALETVAQEQSADQNRENQATAIEQLTRQARIAEVQETRLEKQLERKAEARREAKKWENQAKRRERQAQRAAERQRYTIPTIAGCEAAERAKRENEATALQKRENEAKDLQKRENEARDRQKLENEATRRDPEPKSPQPMDRSDLPDNNAKPPGDDYAPDCT